MSDESVFRIVVIINIALTVPIGLYHRIKSQATGEKLARREEGVFIMIGLRLCGLLAWISLAAYLINPASMAWSSVALPTWLRWIGAFLGLFAGPPLLFWTFRSLGKNLTDTVVTRQEHTLVTHGPYRWVRHPFYDVVFLWVVSLSLLTANWLLALLGFSAFAMLVVRTRIEEEKLTERFGDEYRTYTGRTGRFFPHVRSARQ
jgi:protein-S-isoprenylcysteine O-methyltransferase Ste14